MDAHLHCYIPVQGVRAKFCKLGVRWNPNDIVVSWLRL